MSDRTFAENLVAILSGVYGQDVREAIHDALQQAYDHGGDTPESGVATDDTLDSLTAALAQVLGLTISKTFDAANNRYLYTVSKTGEEETGTGFVVIDDTTTGTNKTWSSAKISAKFDEIEEQFDEIAEALSEL